MRIVRDERRRWMPPPLLLLDLGDGPARAFEAAQDLVDPLARVELELLVDPLAVDLRQACAEQRRLPGLEPRLDGPVLLGHEGGDLPLALDDDAHRHRLHASR
jgi:hypothetical protein